MRAPGIASCLPVVLFFFAACGEPVESEPVAAGTDTEATAPSSESEDAAPADLFLARIAEHCGEAFAGTIVANEPPTPDDPFENQPLVMHVRECSDDEIRIPFHVGDDHSRTWILTRTDAGLRLEHDHRHEDGSDDEVTMYGGDTAAEGTGTRQEFPVDQESIEMFEEEGLTASAVNVWAMEIEPGERFLYELARPGTDRMFQVEFDLTNPVPAPPPPWGHPEIDDEDRS